jgi:hypothetical protein
MTKATTALKWVLKNKETGKVFPTFSYPSRSAARKAAKGQRFKGQYMPVKLTVTHTPKTVIKKEVPIIETQVKTTTAKVLNHTPILRKSQGINSFPMHQRWM